MQNINTIIRHVLNEYYSQQFIPFETIRNANGKVEYYGNDNGKKPFIYYFIDFLEENGKYEELPSSKTTVDGQIEENMENALEYYANNFISDKYSKYEVVYEYFRYISDFNVFISLFNNLFDNKLNGEKLEYDDNIGLLRIGNDVFKYNSIGIKNLFDEYGNDKIDDFLDLIDLKKYFLLKLDDTRMLNNLKTNERGLIFIERAITIPFALDTRDSNISDSTDFFKYLTETFGSGIGRYWTWAYGFSSSYCGVVYDNYSQVTLRGWVDPIQIDWVETLWKNTYALRSEREIYLKRNANVELFQVIVDNKTNVLRKNLVVQA